MRILPACLLTLIPFFGFSQTETKLLAPDGAASDEFGDAVAKWGNVVLAGAPKNNDINPGCGTVYFYRENNGTWTMEQKVTPLDPDQDDRFGISVDLFGDVAIVGACLDDENGINAGAAYIFRHNGSIWVQEDKLIASDGAAGDEFGYSVSVYDSIAVVGSYRSVISGTGNGAVYIFKYNGINWPQLQKLSGTAPQIDDFFGYNVDIHKDRLIVGAYQDDDMGVNSGSAYIFSWNGGMFSLEQKIFPADGQPGDAFGFSVGINDSLAVIGAYGKDVLASASGAAYVYRRTGNSWNQEQVLSAPDGATDDWLGYSVSISGKTIVAGAFHDDDLGSESGSVYIYRYTGSNWMFEFPLRATDANTNDNYGICTVVDNMDIVIGAPFNDDNGTNSGSVYVYPMCTFLPVQELCMASVNTNFNENILIWEKRNTTYIDSFLVYRFNGTGDDLLTTLPYSSVGEFIDNGANLIASGYSYHLTTKNVCNVESQAGSYHKTIHLTTTPGSPGQTILNWDVQLGFSFPYYRVWRDTTGTGAFHLIYATLNSQFTYTDNSAPLTTPLDYYIEVQRSAGACMNGQTSRVSAYSNKSNPALSSISESTNDLKFSLYPNPSQGILNVKFENSENTSATISLIDLSGKLVYTTTTKENHQLILLHEIPFGYYFVKLETGQKTAVLPMVYIP
ncbi:MAG: T9SS type A sorting domain-containing protein [Flavobacteriales bacterium]|nr:T9SS type A sorting domain-containing protein [Flavobacteriales bacterium]